MKILIGVLYAVLFLSLFVSLAQAKSLPPALPECILANEGIVTSAWVKHRILIGDKVVYGANDLDSISRHLHQFRSQGLCQ